MERSSQKKDEAEEHLKELFDKHWERLFPNGKVRSGNVRDFIKEFYRLGHADGVNDALTDVLSDL